MANLLELSQIRNHPSRSAFDLSSHRPFTAKAGELLPVYWRMCYPGDSWTLKHQHFTRTQPVNTAAFARFREYFDWYFVPMRLLNKNIAQALVQMQDNPVQAESLLSSKLVTLDLPYIPSSSTDFEYSISNLLVYASGDTIGSDTFPVYVNFFGFRFTSGMIKLLRYLGYGNVTGDAYTNSRFAYTSVPDSSFSLRADVSVNVNVLPLLAYQKIYCDYFRYQQWEKNEPYTYNCDYYTGGNLLSSIPLDFNNASTFLSQNNFFTLRYANWNKDMFMGVLPNSQLGEIATVQTIGTGGALQSISYKGDSSSPVKPVDVTASNATGNSADLVLSIDNSAPSATFPGSLVVSDSVSKEFNVLQLRMAEALQRYKEISLCHDQTYVDQIEAHWDVRLSKALSDQCLYIGGSATNLNISEIENTNLQGNEALLKGKGIGSGQSSNNFSFNEHGILMCIYHCVPLIDYTVTGQSPELLYTNVSDLPQPEFDRIGLETIPMLSFFNFPKSDENLDPDVKNPLGYLPRYYSAKMDIDRAMGAFETSLKSWVVTLSPQYLSQWFTRSFADNVVLYPYFKVNPSVCDNIFAVKADSTVDTDQFLIDAYFDVKCVRNFDYDGMPY